VRPLLTRSQVERLNGAPLPLLAVVGPTIGPVRHARPEECERWAWTPKPVLFLPISDGERKRWELEERLEQQRARLLCLGIAKELELTDRQRTFLERSSNPRPAERRLSEQLTTTPSAWTEPRLEVP
jgi:hypothetical protein